jgi:hypothetical protein
MAGAEDWRGAMVEKELVRDAAVVTAAAERGVAAAPSFAERLRGAVRWSLAAGWRRNDLDAVRRLRLTADILLCIMTVFFLNKKRQEGQQVIRDWREKCENRT